MMIIMRYNTLGDVLNVLSAINNDYDIDINITAWGVNVIFINYILND